MSSPGYEIHMKMANYLFEAAEILKSTTTTTTEKEMEPKEVLKSAAPMNSHKHLVFSEQSFLDFLTFIGATKSIQE